MSSRFHSPSDIAHPYEYPEMPAEMYAPETYSSNESEDDLYFHNVV